MKSTLALLTLAATNVLHAHPGAPGHTHPENTGTNDWPFPDFSWSLTIVALAIIGLAIYKMLKKA